VLSGCAAQQRDAQLLSAGQPKASAITTLAAPLEANENIRPTELRRGESSSIALVQIRDREQPHVHTRYDLTVTLVRGSGTLWLDGAELPMREGDVALIPKGTPHYFINAGGEPAAALVVFAPPFSGPDQQPIR
jgi:mannose-6-phosphate isomerase-like protein (cupin superfamily)